MRFVIVTTAICAALVGVGCGKNATGGTGTGGGAGGGGGGAAATGHAPVLDQPSNVAMIAGETKTVTFSATDADGDSLSFSIADLPSYATLTGAQLTLTPGADIAETRAILVTVSDGALTDKKSFALTVNAPPNLAPTLSGLAQQDGAGNAVTAGATLSQPPMLLANVVDPEHGQVKLEAEVIPASSTFSGLPTNTGALSSEPTIGLQLPTLPPGAWKWQVRAVDSVGGASDWLPFNSGQTAFTIEPGTFNATLTIGTGATVTNSPVVDLALSATPPAGATLVSMRFSNDGTNYSAIEPFSATRSGWALAPGNGQKTVTAEVKASNGDVATVTAQIVLDTTAPTIAAFTIESGAAVTKASAVTLTYTANDTGTGVTTVEASNDGTTFTAIGASPASGWTLATGDGFKTLTLRVTDGAGNASTATAFIRLDQTPPVLVSALITPTITNSANVQLTVIATDGSGSGLDQLCISGPVATPGCQAFPATSSVPVTLTGSDGTKVLTVTVSDLAGNNSTNSVTAQTRLDTTPPTAPPTPLLTGGHRSISATWAAATDPSGSGIAGYEVAINAAADAGTWTFVPAATLNSHVFTGVPNSPDLTPIATRYVEVRARDNAGNVGPASAPAGGFAHWPFRYGYRDAVPTINGLAFADDNTVVAVGDSSLVLTSTGPWTGATPTHSVRRDPLVDANLRAVAALNNGAALIAVGAPPSGSSLPAMLLSTDKGQSWSQLTAPSAVNFRTLYAVAPTTVSGSVFGFTAVGLNGAVVNGTWNQTTNAVTLTAPTPVTSQALLGVTGCQAFACNSTVIAVGTGGTIIRSTDGGGTFATVASNFGNGNLNSVTHEGGTVAVFYAVGNDSAGNNVIRSTDNGATWLADITGTGAADGGSAGLLSVAGLGNGSVMAASSPYSYWGPGYPNGYSNTGIVYRISTNSGAAAYTGVNRPRPPMGNFTSVAARTSATSQKMFAWGGEWGQIAISVDNGATWYDQWITGSNWLHHFDVNPSGTRVMAIGYAQNPNPSFYGPSDQSTAWLGDAFGQTWTAQTVPEQSGYRGIQAFSWQGDNEGFSLGRASSMWQMSTSSSTWQGSVLTGTNDNFHGVDCVQTHECLAVGNEGHISRYTGTLASLTPLSENGSTAAVPGCPLKADGNACGAQNNGYCCTAPYWYGVTYFQDVSNPNLFHGLAVGSGPAGDNSRASVRSLTVSFSGGIGTPVLDPIQALTLTTNLNRVAGRPTGIAIAVGGNGTIMRSLTYGAAGSWAKINSPVFTTFNAIAAGPNADWFIAGNSGILLKSSDDGLTWKQLPTYTNRNLLSVSTHPVTNLMWLSADGPGALFSQTGGE